VFLLRPVRWVRTLKINVTLELPCNRSPDPTSTFGRISKIERSGAAICPNSKCGVDKRPLLSSRGAYLSSTFHHAWHSAKASARPLQMLPGRSVSASPQRTSGQSDLITRLLLSMVQRVAGVLKFKSSHMLHFWTTLIQRWPKFQRLARGVSARLMSLETLKRLYPVTGFQNRSLSESHAWTRGPQESF
jgi:hypothetical protein